MEFAEISEIVALVQEFAESLEETLIYCQESDKVLGLSDFKIQ